MEFNDYQTLLKQIPFGKRLPTALYLHVDGLSCLPVALQQLLEQIVTQFSLATYDYQLIKFYTNAFKLSLLRYPRFFTDPFPALTESYNLDLAAQRLQHRFYHTTANPPILHRKELFLPPHHPAIPAFRSITLAAEQAGLFVNTKTIGFKQNWEKLMQEKGFTLPNE
jgi:DNA phosphorothioation-associated putative methyltransferase